MPVEYSRGSETILLVEDESPLRHVVCDLLKQLGYQVLEAGSGEEALVLAEKHGAGIDLLLTDVRMPEMEGPELASRLKGQRPELKVVFISGYVGSSLGADGVLPAGTVLLQKPFTMRLLADTLRKVLDDNRA